MIEYYQFKDALTETTHKVINFRATLIVVCTLIVVYILIRLLSRISGYIAKTIIKVTDETKLSDKMVAFKRVETWIDVGMAVAKIIIVVVAFYVAWRLISPSSAPLAFIGASAFFVVLAGGTRTFVARLYRWLYDDCREMVRGWRFYKNHAIF